MPDRPILVTGARGQVGAALARLAQRPVVALDRARLDITDEAAVRAAVAASGAAAVINAAAFTDVDRAEDEPRLAHAVNADGPAHLAAACDHAGIPLIHISTDYVFDGEAGRPYREDDPVRPINAYGESKLAGEAAIRDRLAHHVIARTSWVYAPDHRNFVTTIARLARERETLQVVADQLGTPTPAEGLARALLAIAERAIGASGELPWGTFHLAGRPAVSRYELALAVLAAERERGPVACRAIEPVASGAFPTRAARPANTALDASRALELWGVEVGEWRV
jgi:dTDP-4-dehydrorhamnose reductase